MVDAIQSTNAGASTAASSRTANTTQSERSVVNSDFETFIKMLTVQVENQDPLNPIESSDFATQLATFSGVEQQVLTNELLSSLSAQLGSSDLSDVADWIGMEARVAGPVNYDGSPVKLTIAAGADAEKHELVIRDADGLIVAREEVAPERQTVFWGGRDASGEPLPPGTYNLSVVSTTEGVEVAQSPAEVHGQIMEARLNGTQTRLILDSGQEIAPQNVLGLRHITTASE